jgi:hypothetical protein
VAVPERVAPELAAVPPCDAVEDGGHAALGDDLGLGEEEEVVAALVVRVEGPAGAVEPEERPGGACL